MTARKSVVRLLAHATMVVGAIFVVTVLLAAMPGHNAPAVQAIGAEPQAQGPGAQEMPGMDHRQMNMDSGDERESEKAAVADMNHMHGSSPHLYMTQMRAPRAADTQRADQIVTELRAGIEKYKEYHATSYKNGFLAAMRFAPSEPTSLLYRKTADGYELVGAMYTMPKRASEDQLNERVPLSVAMWHLHTNLCVPAGAQRASADWTKFGLR